MQNFQAILNVKMYDSIKELKVAKCQSVFP